MRVFVYLLLAALVLSACTTNESPTEAPESDDATTPSLVTPTASIEPSDTEPTDTDQSEPSTTAPMLSATGPGITVWSGPGLNFVELGSLPARTEVEIVGQTTDTGGATWLALRHMGWTSLHHEADASVSVPLSDIPVVEAGIAEAAGPLHTGIPTTGLESVDSVIRAVVKGEQTALAELVDLHMRACSTAGRQPGTAERRPGPGQPPCPAGSADGTPVETFHIAGCSVESRAAEQAAQAVNAFFDPAFAGSAIEQAGNPSPLFLYAVRTAEPDANYWLVFAAEPRGPAHSLTVARDGGITSFRYGCSGKSAALSVPGDGLVLPPPIPAGVEPLSN